MNATLPQTNIEELVIKILMNRCLTPADQQFLKCAVLYKDSLNEHERILIERVFYGIRHGLLQILESTSV
ncbi:MAG: hypothetical protein RIE73_03415 [Coleofasciculus sp. C1-SOL-03]|jgi:hypothetical protein|uniref:hypothetical protein n=1 Tax=Coleofasciculus sp. C1-SOL-03 TaxID=3069522 RepID=UPI0032F593B8